MSRGDGHDAVRRARTLTVLALVGWFAAACIGGLMGIINEPARPPLFLVGFIALPILGFVAAYVSSVFFRAFADTPSLTLLVGLHLWRVFGGGVLIGWLNCAPPARFGVPAG